MAFPTAPVGLRSGRGTGLVGGMNGRSASPPPFAFLPPALRQSIAAHLVERRVPAGKTILSNGARSLDVFCLVSGAARIVLHSPAGRAVSVRDLAPGDVFGELAALDGGPRSASVVAIEPVTLSVMARSDFLKCLETSPEASLWLARRLGAEVRRLTERVFELSALNMQARLHSELLRLARLAAPSTVIAPAPTHEELGARIGSHREAVTRELRRLARLGVITTGHKRLCFLDLERLEMSVRELASVSDPLT